MEEIVAILNKLLDSQKDDALMTQLYTKLSAYTPLENEEKSLLEDVFPKIRELCTHNKIQKDALYLRFLESKNLCLLDALIKYDKALVKDVKSLSVPDKDAYNKIFILKLMQMAISSETDLKYMEKLLEEMNAEDADADDFWECCAEELNHVINVLCSDDDQIWAISEPRLNACNSVFALNFTKYLVSEDVYDTLVNIHTKGDVLEKQTTEKAQPQICSSAEKPKMEEDLLKYALKAACWKALYHLLENVPENQIEKRGELSRLRDMVIVNLIKNGVVVNPYKYVSFIKDRDLRIESVLGNVRNWPGKVCVEVIKAEIGCFDAVESEGRCKLEKLLGQIELCDKVRKCMDLRSWTEALELCENEKDDVFLKLLELGEAESLLKFMKLHSPDEHRLQTIKAEHLEQILEKTDNQNVTMEFLNKLPLEHASNMCYDLLKAVKKLNHHIIIVDYLLKQVNDEKLRKIKISLKMLAEFPSNEHAQFLCLLPEPLDIIEVLIMNMMFDKLSIALKILKCEVLHTEFSDERLSTENIDEVLRNYAEKSLDFRVVTHLNQECLRTQDGSKKFVMPETTPTKEEWVPNDEVVDCMCCRKMTFSMFNRRHHCRRCGRVICYNCSQHRMLVPSYEEVLVRVCLDCFRETVGDGETGSESAASRKVLSHDFWYLTDDPQTNKIVREEFSYEHAPSVSLCLSIMKHHSKNIEYPKFLLEQCNVMLQLLQPTQEPPKEIDYVLVVKMLKSLALAAKMASHEGNLHYGTTLADNILSQADLLHLLAERGCLNLLPVQSNYTQNPYIDAAVIRKLRDRLLEEEQWNLALEVSTKTGLDNTGVFAAWGEACLKVGCLQLAREKFQRCLDKNGYYESLTDLSFAAGNSSCLENSRNSLLSTNSSITSETKPSKDPPLLKEIIHILESNTTRVHPDIITQLEKRRASGSVVNSEQSPIFNRLKRLKNLSEGIYQPSENVLYPLKPPMHKIFYEECLFYLGKYGTRVSMIEFLINHGDMNKALSYMLECRSSPDFFIEIYTLCLKDGIVEVLQGNMSAIDSTLDVWKDYLRPVCRHLEKHKMLHSLYQLQKFMGDYIRAAMTCIRFYQANVTSFKDLLNNADQLHMAEEHLKHVLEQEQWVDVAPVRRTSSASKEDFEAKAIVNPSLVMRMSQNDINKHISTISRQEEIVEYLAECEANGEKLVEILDNTFPIEGSENVSAQDHKVKVPTLFGTTKEKNQLAVLVIVGGQTVEDGCKLAASIIQEFNMKPMKIYCEAGKQLAKAERYDGIVQLISCIKQQGTNDKLINDICDEMLASAVATFTKANVSGARVEDLIKLISDLGTKISAYIEAKQLKTAYFLAVKYKRISHIRRIMKEAELLNQPRIKTLCQKVLQNHSHSPMHSKDNS